MYERFFGLRERPFDLVPNPRFLFLTPRQREALSNLRLGLGTAKGLTLLIGEAGTGKTTLLQAALPDANQGIVECVLLSNPTLSRREFYEFLTRSFNLGPEAAISKTQFLFEFRRHLQARHAAGQLSALVLDEAQSLPYELLEEVRLLGNIETPTEKLLNVVLAGQPELAGRLNEPGLRQLKQRIVLRCELAPFNASETGAYIAGRLRMAGGEPASIFTREAILTIREASGGVPRTINVICDNALIAGFAAQVKPVRRALVEEVCRDFDLDKPSRGPAAPERPSRNGDEAGAERERVTAPAAAPRGAVAVKEREAPMFATVDRKKRFSFF